MHNPFILAGFGRSCAALKAHAKGTVTSGMKQIDVDGAGPLPAATVECIYDHNKVTTNVYPKIASNLAVENRFGMKSIFVPYNADARSLVSITQESLECHQHVKYVCTKSSLYDSPNGQPKVRISIYREVSALLQSNVLLTGENKAL